MNLYSLRYFPFGQHSLKSMIGNNYLGIRSICYVLRKNCISINFNLAYSALIFYIFDFQIIFWLYIKFPYASKKQMRKCQVKH